MRLIGRNHKPPGFPNRTPKVPHWKTGPTTDAPPAPLHGHNTESTRLPTGHAPALLTLLSVSNLLAGLARVRGRGLAAFLGVREVLTTDLRH